MPLARFIAWHSIAEDDLPETLENEEIGGLSRWSAKSAPQPLGDTDAALLQRFGVAR